jgi:hypothetical protein
VHGRLLEPDEMRRARDPSSIGPGALWRLLREVKPPSSDEGFASLEVLPFVRRARAGAERAATFVAIDAIERVPRGADDLVLVFGWRPGATKEWIEEVRARVNAPFVCCAHPPGVARCWCRPPLPGLILWLAEKHAVALDKSAIVGTSDAHARMAGALSTEYRWGRS